MIAKYFLPLLMVSAILVLVNVACSNDDYKYPDPTLVPTPSYSETMEGWKQCMIDGVLDAPRVNYWEARKDRVWFMCLPYLPDGKYEEAKKIANAIEKPVEKKN